MRRVEANFYVTLGTFLSLIFMIALLYAADGLKYSQSYKEMFFWSAITLMIAQQILKCLEFVITGFSGLREKDQ